MGMAVSLCLSWFVGEVGLPQVDVDRLSQNGGRGRGVPGAPNFSPLYFSSSRLTIRLHTKN